MYGKQIYKRGKSNEYERINSFANNTTNKKNYTTILPFYGIWPIFKLY